MMQSVTISAARARSFVAPIAYALAAFACAVTAAVIATHHPLWPAGATALLCCWALVVLRWPNTWLLVVPAVLPFLNLSPWTGWLACDEFDLLALGWLAAGHARLAFKSVQAHEPAHLAEAGRRWLQVLLWALVLWTLAGIARGFVNAGTLAVDPFQAYTGPANSLRVGKSLLYALLAWPLLRDTQRNASQAAARLLPIGLLVGLTGVVIVAVWERLSFPGLWNFSERYRVTAMFWEMHVGGAAIDAYLALTVPFIAWALWSVRRPWQWGLIALMAVLTAYVCLVSYSRGVYASVVGGLVVSGVLIRMQKTGFDPASVLTRLKQGAQPVRWRSRAGIGLMLVLVLEVALVLGAGSFLAERMAASNQDLGSRWSHWMRGISLLRGPVDAAVGIGLGRLPARYGVAGRRGEFSGAVAVNSTGGPEPASGPFVTVTGPRTQFKLAGLFALTQRVDLASDAFYTVEMDVRVRRPTDLLLQVCERHLLYEGDCQDEVLRITPDGPLWKGIEVELNGRALTGGPGPVPRPVMFSLAVANPGGAVDVANIRLSAGPRHDLLANGSFADGMAHWFAAAQIYFLPWHIDNLYLEWLIERGAIGLLLFALLMAAALWHLVFGPARKLRIAPYLAASLCSVLAVGLVSSVMDAPRVAFLMLLLALWSLQLRERQ